ncbi:hypothetical protein A2316_01760 [Candidatus Falkowbacteria bacterium RIFOXYB2_FULL_38_15]|uniref:Uncharacterized protein n=1 Tax=Candidatus Falkowbacteria bacterium RIFOXYA2_FULL_38_12 TaxID=1797993 RepID=A0A1F5S311_9BACT|nr:MAG: hypothetical protein A2257_03540 [Candidatus Falkowbacteria bacterium RIFOXYA2_FULL_38_12]OGF32678.1 MAG: hypothetical protein A2316_01760 [Candidatus Falkowbacteria bacterium RIFOXYB2_FULL_38_15]OGF42082.1 MAG: hypothetical protein A2555_01655 [Candidatus Falkowbacteria bacterium RIFOXYD2_FULL_39_16]
MKSISVFAKATARQEATAEIKNTKKKAEAKLLLNRNFTLALKKRVLVLRNSFFILFFNPYSMGLLRSRSQ